MWKQHRSGLFIVGAVAITAASVLAACGGDDSGGSDSTTSNKPASTAAGGAAGTKAPASAAVAIPAGAAVIDQVETTTFKPDKASVKVGEAVYFKNSEAAIHSVNIDGKNIRGAGGLMKQGEAASWTPTKAGTYAVTCDYHPQMKATITVQ